MYKEFEEWLNSILQKKFPENVVAANFNIYEDLDKEWSVEIVGTNAFDEEDEDWACEEVTDLDSRDNPFVFTFDGEWTAVLEIVIEYVAKYLECGQARHELKKLEAVGTGFVDGNIEIVFKK